MSATYVYKIKSKFKKNPNLLCHYGFNMYESEQDDEVIFPAVFCSIVSVKSGSFTSVSLPHFTQIIWSWCVVLSNISGNPDSEIRIILPSFTRLFKLL